MLNYLDIKDRFDASRHPDVVQGKKSAHEVLNEWLETFEEHHNTATGGSNDSTVTREEWNEYYTNISSSIDDDAYFELMMNNAWKMNGVVKTYNTGWASQNAHIPPQPTSGYHYGGARPFSQQSPILRGGVTQETYSYNQASTPFG